MQPSPHRHVKTLRLCLLLLLAALLPIRGAVAAAMLCPPGGHGMVAQQPRGSTAGPSPADQAGMPHAAMAHAASAPHHHAAGPAAAAHTLATASAPIPAPPPVDHAHGAGDTCHLCAAFCSLTPLLSDLPRLPEPQAGASVRFPAFSAPAPRFQSGGPERPPRTC